MRRLLLLVAVCYVLAPVVTARAGGTNVPVVVSGGTVWIADAPWVLGLEVADGRVTRRVPVANAYPLELARGGGATWVSSVENGFIAGAVTRIGPRGRTTVPLRLQHAPVLDLATGAGGAWALVGPWPRARLVRIDFATGRTRTVPLPGGRPRALAGDGTTAVVVSDHGRLFQLTRRRPTPVGGVPPQSLPLAADRDGVWIASGRALSWVDLRDGRRRAILPGSVEDVAFGGGEAYAIRYRGDETEVVRFDQDGGRIYARRLLPHAQHLAFGAGSLWVSEVGPVRGARLLRLDRTTLATAWSRSF